MGRGLVSAFRLPLLYLDFCPHWESLFPSPTDQFEAIESAQLRNISMAICVGSGREFRRFGPLHGNLPERSAVTYFTIDRGK